MAAISTGRLRDWVPVDDAKNPLSWGQKFVGIAALGIGIFVVGWYSVPLLLIAKITIAFITAFYLLAFLMALYTIHSSVDAGLLSVSEEELEAYRYSVMPEDWPVYSILVPLYKEPEVVEGLIRSLCQLEYPKSRLEVLLLLEQDDGETQAALDAAFPVLPSFIRKVIVPVSQPRTKPKALNYGLQQVRVDSEFTAVFDAEDSPEPDQLAKVVVAFKTMVDEETVCIQAKLAYHNARQNWLTRFFSAEYSTFYNLVLPGLGKSRLFVPLGGTSNHFFTRVLRDIRGWDAYNVTEDCDLGVRLVKEGYKVRLIDSITWEEANSRVRSWIKQRSRWIKGYMQTFLVHNRNPLVTMSQMGVRRFFSFELMIGGSILSLLINPIFWVLSLVYLFTSSQTIEAFYPGPIFYMGLIAFCLGNFTFIYSQLVGAMLQEEYGNVIWVLGAPLYWLLMSIAAWKALQQLITKPHYWEKTKHFGTAKVQR